MLGTKAEDWLKEVSSSGSRATTDYMLSDRNSYLFLKLVFRWRWQSSIVVPVPPEVLICEDDPAILTALAVTATGLFGFRLGGVTHCAVGTIAAVQSAAVKPDMVVLDLALFGNLGMRSIRTLLDLAPACQVVVIVTPSFWRAGLAARRAGAMAVIDAHDLRPFRDCLQIVLAKKHAGSSCRCCLPSRVP